MSRGASRMRWGRSDSRGPDPFCTVTPTPRSGPTRVGGADLPERGVLTCGRRMAGTRPKVTRAHAFPAARVAIAKGADEPPGHRQDAVRPRQGAPQPREGRGPHARRRRGAARGAAGRTAEAGRRGHAARTPLTRNARIGSRRRPRGHRGWGRACGGATADGRRAPFGGEERVWELGGGDVVLPLWMYERDRSVHVKTARFMFCEFRPNRKHDPSPMGRWRRPDRPFLHSAAAQARPAASAAAGEGQNVGLIPVTGTQQSVNPSGGRPDNPAPPAPQHAHTRSRVSEPLGHAGKKRRAAA